jgi:hypothetical protein
VAGRRLDIRLVPFMVAIRLMPLGLRRRRADPGVIVEPLQPLGLGSTPRWPERFALQPLDLSGIGASTALQVEMLADRIVQQTHRHISLPGS